MHKCHGHVFLVELLLSGHIISWLFSSAYFPSSDNSSERRP
jgi:hypothetical protein